MEADWHANILWKSPVFQNDGSQLLVIEPKKSDLNIFFDSKAEENLNIESIYTLGAGLVIMFEKLALRHG